jgi:ribokinase
MPHAPLRIAVVGHVEHVTIAAVPRLPERGEIAHLDGAIALPGGGGGNAFFQLARSPAELHLFTALGNDDAARFVEQRIEATGAHIHAARRDEPHTRDLVLVSPDGERTIFVVGEPLHPRRDDPLPWHLLSACRAAYFTAQDPEGLRSCRDAELLIVTARRAEALARSRVRADVVVGSALDTREASALVDYAVPPGALVMTEGAQGGYIETTDGITRFAAVKRPPGASGAYGAGDSFAGALVWYLAAGLEIEAACARAAVHGAAVLRGLNALEHQLPLD